MLVVTAVEEDGVSTMEEEEGVTVEEEEGVTAEEEEVVIVAVIVLVVTSAVVTLVASHASLLWSCHQAQALANSWLKRSGLAQDTIHMPALVMKAMYSEVPLLHIMVRDLRKFWEELSLVQSL